MIQRTHPENVQRAIQRYQNETARRVLDAFLAVQPGGWLVDGKPTIADIVFVPCHKPGC